MALPTPELTWQYNVNNSVGGVSQLADAQNAIFTIKEALKNFALNPWTVVGSSDSSVAAMDGVDRWVTSSNVVWGDTGSSKAWIVLQQNPTGAQLLFFCQAQNGAGFFGRDAVAVYSPTGGFTGNSTTTRPTAPDEIVMLNTTFAWLAGIFGSSVYKIHILHDSTGKHTYVFICTQNLCTSAWFFTEVLDPITNFTAPRTCRFPNNVALDESTGGPSFNTLHDADNLRSKNAATGTTISVSMVTEMTVNDAIGQRYNVANELTGEFHLSSIQLASATLGFRGLIGRWPDMWFGTSVLPSGTTYPSTTARTFVQFGDVVVPWNGTIPLVA